MIHFFYLVHPGHAQANSSGAAIGGESGASGDRQDFKIQTHPCRTCQYLVPTRQAEKAQEPECEKSQSVQAK